MADYRSVDAQGIKAGDNIFVLMVPAGSKPLAPGSSVLGGLAATESSQKASGIAAALQVKIAWGGHGTSSDAGTGDDTGVAASSRGPLTARDSTANHADSGEDEDDDTRWTALVGGAAIPIGSGCHAILATGPSIARAPCGLVSGCMQWSVRVSGMNAGDENALLGVCHRRLLHPLYKSAGSGFLGMRCVDGGTWRDGSRGPRVPAL